MPQGKIISIKPIGFTEEKEYTEEEFKKCGCHGTIEFIDDIYKGQTGYFIDADKKCCDKKEGDIVDIVSAKGIILVEINC